ncbi:aspartate/glutamate racemase family protein [Puniceicoccaceae bacterium K14]|nr:aspartate/glutamate racemase family protein [Puniceicoccaceae bacterium K14]
MNLIYVVEGSGSAEIIIWMSKENMISMIRAREAVLGIVGGVGPIASAEFVKTIYEHDDYQLEQELPRVLLCSDPHIPDRTEALLAGREYDLVNALTPLLLKLKDGGATDLVVCCFTMHAIFDLLPDHVSKNLISLVEIALLEIIDKDEPHLLLCTLGSRKALSFVCHPLWKRASKNVVMPDEKDQKKLHDIIYNVIKQDRGIGTVLPWLESILKKYEVNSFLSGCTEIHLLVKYIKRNPDFAERIGYVDPLLSIASRWKTPIVRQLQPVG